MNSIVARGLVKRYGGLLALDELSFEVPRGSICAVIGPNGCGKTTTFGLLAGLLRADAGQIELFGDGPFDASRHAGRISLMPQDALPSPHATLRQSLRYYGELQGLERSHAWQQADRWLEQVRLAERADARQSQLSHGMRRRFSVAQALLGEPELILLDEPTAGVDPELAAELRALFRAQSGRATLLISSHVLSELEELCDHAIVIEKGRAVRQGSMQSLLQADTLVRVTLSAPADLTRLSAQLPGARLEWEAPELRVRWSDAAPLEQLNARLLGALLEQGVGILALAAGQSLEASYLAERRAAAQASPPIPSPPKMPSKPLPPQPLR